MKTELRIAEHFMRPGEVMIELWYGDQLIGAVYPPLTGPGVRIISKYLRNSHEAICLVADDPPVLDVRLAP